MFNTQQEIQANYESLIHGIKANILKVKRKIDRFSFVRVALLLVEIALFVSFVSANDDLATLLSGLSLILPIIVFIVVVKKQNVLTAQENYLQNLLWIYQNELNLMSGDRNGYDDGSAFEDDQHPYIADLDVFGKSSLFALINRCTTKKGNQKLADYLRIESDKETILSRQIAIKEIVSQIRDTFDFRATLRGHDVGKIDQIKYKLKEQLAEQLKFTHRQFLRIYVKIVPFLTIPLLLVGIIIGGKLWGILSIIALVHASILFYHMKSINQVYYGFSGSALLLADYSKAIAWTEKNDWKSDYIKDLFSPGDRVSRQINKLAKIIQAFDARLNILLGAALNFFFLWDLRCCIKIDEWYRHSANNVDNGLDRIGHFEELISIATLKFNHPDWTFPLIEDHFCFSTTSIGHPLIAVPKRIHNQFEVSLTPTVDIITGSNMAGKSTFLRTIGINMILAYLGAPVCAANMRLSIFKLLTYMRIKDSLNENTSTFKAELNRLKLILTNVVLYKNSFVLIDEMLRGTNSKDKFMGSKAFIERLIELNTPTLFATHDLQLSDLKETHADAIRNFHFDIQINNGEMDFDYKLKEGPCTIFNAAILLKEIGLSLA